jgi:hypothetical protein
MVVHVKGFLALCGGDILLEIVEPSIVDKNVATLVLLADNPAKGGDTGDTGGTGLVGEGQLSKGGFAQLEE